MPNQRYELLVRQVPYESSWGYDMRSSLVLLWLFYVIPIAEVVVDDFVDLHTACVAVVGLHVMIVLEGVITSENVTEPMALLYRFNQNFK